MLPATSWPQVDPVPRSSGGRSGHALLVPAEGLDLAYLDRVIRLVCVTADRLEEATSGGDTF